MLIYPLFAIQPIYVSIENLLLFVALECIHLPPYMPYNTF